MSPSGQVVHVCSVRMLSWGPVPGTVHIFFLGIMVKIIDFGISQPDFEPWLLQRCPTRDCGPVPPEPQFPQWRDNF